MRRYLVPSLVALTCLLAVPALANMMPPEDPPKGGVPTEPAAPPPGHGEHGDTGTAASPPDVALFDDLGVFSRTITTSVPETQAYFNQGVRLLFNFNHAEAILAFEKAASLDPQCAMCWWGVAFAYGPNINMPMAPEANAPAWDALAKARGLMQFANAAEQDWILALAERYAAEAPEDRAPLDVAFAKAMRSLHEKYPDDVDAAVFYAEALMDSSPWNYWEADRVTPREGLEDLIPTLEAAMAKAPEHPGALHLYIHAVEASTDPGRAEAAADKLGNLQPGAGHLVHMPTHIYNRIGRYGDAVDWNVKAAIADEAYMAATGRVGMYGAMYYVHNLHFVWSAASNEGRSAQAIDYAGRVVSKIDPDAARQIPMVETFMPTAWLAMLRFGHWDEVLQTEAPHPDFQFATAMWHYARARALAAKGDAAGADAEHAYVVAAVVDPFTQKFEPYGIPAKQMLEIAERVAAADIARAKGDKAGAVAALTEAVAKQDVLPYTEPPYWDFPTRQALGAALLENGQAAEAEAVYRQDLVEWPKNGWSLFGLAQALDAQGKTEEAAAVRVDLATAWTRADVTLTASRF